MHIQLDDSGPFVIATVTGPFGAADAPTFIETLDEPASGVGAALAIDLAGVTSIDSSGLSALIHLVTRARMTQGRVVLVSPPAFVTGILSVTRLDQWFEICDSVDVAEHRFTSQ